MYCATRSALGLSILVLASTAAFPSDLPTGPELLERAIEYHDPDGVWGGDPLQFTLEGTRPDGETSVTEIGIDLESEVFTWSTVRDGHDLAARIEGDSWQARMDGSTDIPAEASKKYRLSEADVERKRDYYTYLWGLPMKLRDPGTRIDAEVMETDFDGRSVLAIRVTYDEAVGGDTWYFYFDPSTAALAGYRFFHDESKNDGEYIALEGETVLGTLRLPRTRAWYYNTDDGYLGTDTLVSLSPAPAVAN